MVHVHKNDIKMSMLFIQQIPTMKDSHTTSLDGPSSVSERMKKYENDEKKPLWKVLCFRILAVSVVALFIKGIFLGIDSYFAFIDDDYVNLKNISLYSLTKNGILTFVYLKKIENKSLLYAFEMNEEEKIYASEGEMSNLIGLPNSKRFLFSENTNSHILKESIHAERKDLYVGINCICMAQDFDTNLVFTLIFSVGQFYIKNEENQGIILRLNNNFYSSNGQYFLDFIGPMFVNFKRGIVHLVEKYSEGFNLIMINESNLFTLWNSKNQFSYIVSSDNQKFVIYELESDSIKIFLRKEYVFSNESEYNNSLKLNESNCTIIDKKIKEDFMIKRLLFSEDNESIFVLICEKNNMKNCKVVKYLLNNSEVEDMFNCNSCTDFILVQNDY